MIERYPLCWPSGKPRTPPSRRGRGKFSVRPGQAIDQITYELGRLRARDVIISSNVPVRQDGLPYASAKEPDDPGVAVYWTSRSGGPMVIAIDIWHRWHHNLRAVALSLEALRGLKRWGSEGIMEQAFAGFAALPPAGEDWRAVLGFGALVIPSRQELVERYRDLAARHHPDHGGSRHEFERVVAAKEAAMAELYR